MDLLVRTSGESRLSDFLLLQSSTAHLHFAAALWPDFSFGDMLDALAAYQRAAPALASLRAFCSAASHDAQDDWGTRRQLSSSPSRTICVDGCCCAQCGSDLIVAGMSSDTSNMDACMQRRAGSVIAVHCSNELRPVQVAPCLLQDAMPPAPLGMRRDESHYIDKSSRVYLR